MSTNRKAIRLANVGEISDAAGEMNDIANIDASQNWIEELRPDELEMLHRLDRILSPFECEGGAATNPLADFPFDLISVQKRVLVLKAMCESVYSNAYYSILVGTYYHFCSTGLSSRIQMCWNISGEIRAHGVT
jgi:hypothetical protein